MNTGELGICSWSLRPSSPTDLAEKVRACGLDAVQLALDPIRRGEWREENVVRVLSDGGVRMVSGMMAFAGEDYSTLESIRETGGVRVDERWEEHLDSAKGNAGIASRIGLKLVTFHAGFLSEEECEERRVMIDRLRMIADAYGEHDIEVAFETGQERAETLITVLRELEREHVGVNFDPANMILYGMGKPVDALRLLSRWVKQIHIKDAVPAERAGTWGRETAVGKGAVNWQELFDVVRDEIGSADMMIEREAGHSRIEDVRNACEIVRRMCEMRKRDAGHE